MNEVTKIHLGRQAFTVSLTAHKQLRAYLDAIEQQVGTRGEEVIKEVELRMAELLAERGVSGEKVVLPDDVAFLKAQLGEPNDFRDEESEAAAPTSKENPAGQKRLFRDTEHGMAAGVAAGLAAYFGIDAVIVRLLFVVLTLAWGWGALLYLLLWLIVPEAKTSSERLQMRGMPVTVDSLKEIVDRADVPAAARRANKVVASVASGAGRVFMTIVGIGFSVAAFAVFLGTVVSGTYLLIHGSEAGGAIVFPLGTQEVLVVVSAIVALMALAALLAVIGISCLRRRWSLPGWPLAILLVGMFTAAALGTALALDAAPAVRHRYEKLDHTQTMTVPAFTAAELTGRDTDFIYQQDTRSYVELRFFGPDRSVPVTAEVINNTLKLDASHYRAEQTCHFLCLYSDERLEVVLHAPTLETATVRGRGSFVNNEPFVQGTLQLTIDPEVQFNVQHTAVRNIAVALPQDASDIRVRLDGLQSGLQDALNLQTYGGIMHIDHFGELALRAPQDACHEHEPRLYVSEADSAARITINGRRLQSSDELRQLRSPDVRNAYNCLVLQ